MTKDLIVLQQVSFKVAGFSDAILQNISYSIQSQDFVILLGSNGSGKSSLLKILDRRYLATAGCVMLENQAIGSYSARVFGKKVATLTQDCKDSLFGSLTIFENYLLAKQCGRCISCFRLRTSYEHTCFYNYLENFSPQLANQPHATVNTLSGGEQQILALALSVLYPPAVLLLDEHTSALDPVTAKRLMQITQAVIEKYRITCVLSTHCIPIALQYGSRILVLQQGQISRCIESEEKLKLSEQDIRGFYSTL